MSWNTLDPIKDVPYTPPGGGGNISQELIDKINNSITTEDAKEIIKDTTNDNIVFKLSSPFYEGVQDETEFLYPFKGEIQYINTSISLDSVFKSNLLFGIQIYKDNNWITISTIQVQVGHYSVDTTIKVPEPIYKNRLRINFIEGDFTSIKNISFIIKVESPSSE